MLVLSLQLTFLNNGEFLIFVLIDHDGYIFGRNICFFLNKKYNMLVYLSFFFKPKQITFRNICMSHLKVEHDHNYYFQPDKHNRKPHIYCY